MRNYWIKLLVFCLLLGAVPTLFIGLFSYITASQDVKDKVQAANMLVLQQTEMQVEQMLHTLEDSVTQFANTALVQEAFHQSLTNEDFITVRKLTNEMANLRSSADIKDTYIIQFEKEWAIHFAALRKLQELPNLDEFEAYASESKGLMWNTRAKTQPAAQTEPGSDNSMDALEVPEETISLIYKLPLLTGTDKPEGMIVVRVMSDEIRRVLTKSKELGNSYILDASGQMFLSPASEKREYVEINHAIREQISDTSSSSGFFSTKSGGQKLGVSYRVSSYNDWVYVSVSSIAAVTKESQSIGLMTIAVCVSILLLVAAISYFGSQRMYKPIRYLTQLTREANEESGMMEQKDDLVLIQEGIQALASTKSKLKHVMQGQIRHLREFFVIKLFTGQMSEEELIQRTDMYGFPREWEHLLVFAIQIDDLSYTRYADEDRELLLFALNNIVEELLPPDRRFSPVLLGGTQITLIANPEGSKEEILNYAAEQAEMIQAKAMEYLQLQISIGVSRPFQNIADAVIAYGESLEALRCRTSLGSGMIVRVEEIDKRASGETAVYGHLKPLEEQMVHSLREADLEKTIGMLDQYLSAVLHKNSYVKERRILLLQLMMRILQIVQEQGIPVHKIIEGEKTIERFLKLQTHEEIRSWFEHRLLTPIASILQERQESQFVSAAEKIVSIIHERYDQELTLEAIAAELHFHPVYLGRVFKKEVGRTFSDYVSEFRMKMAKHMLETTNMKISEIGEKLRYKNISAFIRAFRKMYGSTPGQYREERSSSRMATEGKSVDHA
ncbi:putative HTH-type transcriptional regulator YtdP [Paenibacillus sp. J45TS6]|uniref:helix-turn-helix domain-containing protein n=1 Tax=Paenibacillus sp. J45TS6 TaxID=2807196 RepID=UPI001B2D2AA7|nr:helix-turn-helix domain-containing protein [Paenibacillus sp. J45TS6]GIP45606.1 putative HTH-type transcriptional regulator YtdP [Paenibacillus sp. J45TS6]